MMELGYSDTPINMVKTNCRFPYEHVINETVLKETYLSPKEKFYSKLKPSTISDKDYKFAIAVFKEGNCSNIEDYMKLYLTNDVFLLAEVFECFRRIIFEKYKLDPAELLTISSTAMQAALYQLGVKFDVIRDNISVKNFDDNIRGGLVSVVRGRTVSNNKHLSNFDETKDDIATLFSMQIPFTELF